MQSLPSPVAALLVLGERLNDLLPSCAPPAPRSSACPGLLRIVQALDGGICRIKLPGGQLSSVQARAIARAASDCASGVLELTNRSNLQIRGVRAGAEAALIAQLLAAGLGPRNANADDVRNLLLSPAAGLDPAALLDTRPLAAQLLSLLEDCPELHALSAKFAVQLDGGEALAMRQHPHDLWLRALPGQPQLIALGLAGCPTDAPLTAVPVEHALALLQGVLRLFLQLASPEQSRMRQLLAELPVADFLVQLQARLPFTLLGVANNHWPPSDAPSSAPVGIFAQQQAGLQMVAAAAQLGRISASQLHALADLAEQQGDCSLRLTPWQGLLLPNIATARSGQVLAELTALQLLTDAAEPLTGIIACTGSTACAKGLADCKGDALLLAAQLRHSGARPLVHLSGCPRSCAAAHIAPYTLLAQAGGSYALYQQDVTQPGFGRLLAPSIRIEQAGDWFAAASLAGNPHA